MPHVHYDSKSEAYHEVSSNEHGHDHVSIEKSSWVDYIFRLLGDVHHTDLGDNHFEYATSQSTSFDIASLDFIAVDFDRVYTKPITMIVLEKTQNLIGHPKILYEQHHVCSSPLRGPPSIS